MGLMIENLSHFYPDGNKKRYVLNNISYYFEPGNFYAIVGHSGSGKTTLLSLMAGLDQVQEGNIYLDKQNIRRFNMEYYRSSKVGIIFQAYNLISYLSAKENILLAMSITQNKLPENQELVAYNLLEYLGLNKSKADRHVSRLSGGEQQRVAIARTLACDTTYILADEPTGNLDDQAEQDLIQIFRALAHKHNKCIIVVTHSIEVAKMADVVIRLHKGGLVNE